MIISISGRAKIAKDIYFIQEIASAVRQVGNTIRSNSSSLCSLIDDGDIGSDDALNILKDHDNLFRRVRKDRKQP
jgi:hypothetical protein